MRIGVIGTGHVGLVTCVTFAEMGHEVVGTDSDTAKIETLRAGKAPFFEEGLEDLLHRALETGRLRFTAAPEEAIAGADAVFICVGTPPRADGEANLLAVERAARSVAHHATGRCVLIEKSTVPTGTPARMRRMLQRQRPDLGDDLEVASNPEFLREGHAVADALDPPRVLVGAEEPWVFERLRELHGSLIDKGCPYIETDIATAELTKHACNAFLALKISFSNALARLSERAGADVGKIADVMGSDPRIGRANLDAGLGYGGSCFHKDLRAFDTLAIKLGYDFPLLREIDRINLEVIDATMEKIKDAVWNLEDKAVALLGLAFKPGTDDVRFAPALALAERLLEEGARVIGYDPRAGATAKAAVPKLEVADDPYSAAQRADCVVLCTEWDEFEELDLTKLSGLMNVPVLVDGRNLFDPAAVQAAGFSYYPMGRPPLLG